MVKLPAEIWDHICWMIENIADLKAMRLVSLQFAQSSLAPLFHTVWIYPNTLSFDKVDAIILHEKVAKLVKKLEYSTDMFRYYPRWVNSFEEWKNQAASGEFLRYRERNHWKPSEEFSLEHLTECHAEWKRMVEGQGRIIERLDSGTLDINGTSQILVREVLRLVACLQRLPNLKTVQWTCDYNERVVYFNRTQQNASEVPLFQDLPEYEQRSLVPRDSTGSKYRHKKQVLSLLEAFYRANTFSQGVAPISELVLLGIKSTYLSTIFCQDNAQWLGLALLNIRSLHLKIDRGDCDMPQGHNTLHIRRCRDSIVQCLSLTNHLEKLTLCSSTLYMSPGLIGAMPSTLKELSIRHSCCTEAGWKHLLTKLDNLEKLDIFSSCIASETARGQGCVMECHPWSQLLAQLMSMTKVKHIRIRGSLRLRQWPRGRMTLLSDSEEDNNDDQMEDDEHEDSEEEEESDGEKSGFLSSSEEEEGEGANEEEVEEDGKPAIPMTMIAEQALKLTGSTRLDDIAVNNKDGNGTERNLVRDIKRKDTARRIQLAFSIKRTGWRVEHFPSTFRDHYAGEILLTRDMISGGGSLSGTT